MFSIVVLDFCFAIFHRETEMDVEIKRMRSGMRGDGDMAEWVRVSAERAEYQSSDLSILKCMPMSSAWCRGGRMGSVWLESTKLHSRFSERHSQGRVLEQHTCQFIFL